MLDVGIKQGAVACRIVRFARGSKKNLPQARNLREV